MTNQEIEATIKADLMEIEARIAHINEVATPEYRASLSPPDRAKGEAAMTLFGNAVDMVHRVFGEISTYFGGGK